MVRVSMANRFSLAPLGTRKAKAQENDFEVPKSPKDWAVLYVFPASSVRTGFASAVPALKSGRTLKSTFTAANSFVSPGRITPRTLFAPGGQSERLRFVTRSTPETVASR